MPTLRLPTSSVLSPSAALRKNVERWKRSAMDDKFAYSISEILDKVPFGRTRLYTEITLGNLVVRKVGRRTLVLAADLRRFLEGLPAVTPRKGGDR